MAGFADSHLAGRRIDAANADDLLGRGEGLTPLGDDVLAGWLLGISWAGIVMLVGSWWTTPGRVAQRQAR